MLRTVEEFLVMGQKELTQALAQGHPINPRDLDDSEYKGISLGLPALIEKLSWKTFKKVFHRDPISGALRGWNVRLKQTGLQGACVPLEKDGKPFSWGFYGVVDNAGRKSPKAVPAGALLIDYGVGGNPAWDFAGLLRDPLVAVHPGSVDMLLGWSFVQAGPWQISTPSFFLLVRDGALTHIAHPPRTPKK